MPLSAEEEARQLANALNELGHIASGQPLTEALQLLGGGRLREAIQESIILCFELIQRTERSSHPAVFPRSADAKAALSQMRDMMPTLDWNDTPSMARLRALARESLESLGIQLPE